MSLFIPGNIDRLRDINGRLLEIGHVLEFAAAAPDLPPHVSRAICGVCAQALESVTANASDLVEDVERTLDEGYSYERQVEEMIDGELIDPADRPY